MAPFSLKFKIRMSIQPLSRGAMPTIHLYRSLYSGPAEVSPFLRRNLRGHLKLSQHQGLTPEKER